MICLSDMAEILLFLFRVAFFPLHMGDHVFVGENSVVNAAAVGSFVYIGNNVVIVSNIVLIKLLVLEFKNFDKKKNF